jgi:ketosteroid isomerase-like protein
MKKGFITCLFIGVLSGALARQTPPPNTPVECTQAFFDALLAKDSPALRALLTVDYAMVSFDGSLIDGATLGEAVASGYITIESGDVSRTYARLYGDTGVVTGTWNARGNLQGYKFDNQISFMAVCVRQGGAWKLAGVQFTPIP